MADINLTQDEADKLMAMEKRAADDKQWLFPLPGDRVAIPLTSLDKRENFMLDVTRAQIKLTKATYQNRARAVIILMRLDLDGPPHRNPDGVEIPCPHLHIYREGYADKWAIPAPLATYTDTLDPSQHSKRSCSNATSSTRLRFRKGYSHDDGAGDRKTSERLPHVAERQDHAARSEW
jgi:hypothetical protein